MITKLFPFIFTAGITFYKAENGVILSKGNGNGCIPRHYFRRAYDRHSGNFFFFNFVHAVIQIQNTRGVQKVLQIDIQKIHKALEFDLI